MSADRLEWALRLADLGFQILPVEAGGKRPVQGYGWADVATTDPDVIREWFEADPGMNYGVHAGSEHVVLDLDKKPDADGEAALLELQVEAGFAPEDCVTDTFRVRTPSGGLHLYLRVPEAVGGRHDFGRGVDVRGYHLYVVGPGCELAGGSDYWVEDEDAEIKDAPEWVRRRLRRPGERAADARVPVVALDSDLAVRRAERYLNHDAPPAIEGRNGDDTTYRVAAWVKDMGVSADECIRIMLSPGGWNSRCAPPWEYGELARKVENAFRYGQNRPGDRGGSAEDMFGAVEGEDAPQDVAALDRAELSGLASLFYDARALMDRRERREMLVQEWLIDNGLTAILAERGAGKTVTMLDLALRIACDMEWHGDPVDQGWAAVYICGEDDEGAAEHFRAWVTRHGVLPDIDRFVFAAGTVDLMSAESVETWTRYIRSEVVRDRRAVVFLDTWQRATYRAGQSDDEDVQLCVHHAEAMARSLGGPLVGAFHPPKGNKTTIMGSSISENSTMGIWNLTNEATGRRLEVTRIKGKGHGNFKIFDFEEVGLEETNKFGKERTGVVPTMIAGSVDHSTADMNVRLRLAYGALMAQLEARRGDDMPGHGPYRKSDLQQRLVQLVRDAESGDEWSLSRMLELKEAGVRRFGKNALYEDVLEKLEKDPRPVVLPDGATVTYMDRRFLVVPADEADALAIEDKEDGDE